VLARPGVTVWEPTDAPVSDAPVGVLARPGGSYHMLTLVNA